MSQLNVDTIKNRLGTGGPVVPSLGVTGIMTASGVSVTGVVTATNFVGSGIGLTGINVNNKAIAMTIVFGT